MHFCSPSPPAPSPFNASLEATPERGNLVGGYIFREGVQPFGKLT
jgi:hypothetical protein